MEQEQRRSSHFTALLKSKPNTPNKDKPMISPKPRSLDQTLNSSSNCKVTPQPRIRTKILSSNLSGEYSNATLPRNIHSVHKSILPINATFSPLKEPGYKYLYCPMLFIPVHQKMIERRAEFPISKRIPIYHILLTILMFYSMFLKNPRSL